MLGRPIHDYDCATDAKPEQTAEAFADCEVIPTGLKHGTVTVLIDRQPVEITTYRTEHAYNDHRHPDQVTFTKQPEEDCRRRDFTINALCYHPEEGILDFVDGLRDIRCGIIRAIGCPDQRFDEDGLRILRAIRFAGQLHFQIEQKTEQALFEKKEILTYLSAERIRAEWDQILCTDEAAVLLNKYRPIIETVIPEFQNIRNLPVLNEAPPDLLIRNALLFHPLQNPGALFSRMRYSRREIRSMENMIRCGKLPCLSRVEQKKLLSVLTVPTEQYAAYRKALNHSAPLNLDEQLATLQSQHVCVHVKDLNISGSELINVPPHLRSTVLNCLLTAVMEEKLPNDHAVLLAAVNEKYN